MSQLTKRVARLLLESRGYVVSEDLLEALLPSMAGLVEQATVIATVLDEAETHSQEDA